MGESKVVAFGVFFQNTSCWDLAHHVGRVGGKGGGSIKKSVILNNLFCFQTFKNLFCVIILFTTISSILSI